MAWISSKTSEKKVHYHGYEKENRKETLQQTGGNRESAAEMLGIGERTLYRKIKEYGL